MLEDQSDDEIPMAPRPLTTDDLADVDMTLSELVAGIIDASTSTKGKDYNPPPEARFISNRNPCTQDERPMESVAFREGEVRPFDIDLDSTSEASYASTPPFNFVSEPTELSSIDLI